MISGVDSLGVGSAAPPNPGGKLGKNEFLKMLVAQLKNQDPLNPMKGDDMAAQLAQFSSLEQLADIGETLKAQGGAQQNMIATLNGTAAMGALGKTVLATGNQVIVPELGDAEVRVSVGGTGGMATLRIYNEAGQEVGSREIGAVGGGRQTFGLGSAAEKLKPGKYTYAVEVVDGSGGNVATQPFMSARIDGVRYGPDGPVLTAGSLTIPFGSIVEILTGTS